MEQKKYYVGLDMGVASVGWAVTDTNYNLMRAKGKDMWGVRLFPEASTSADRRAHRTTRRNLNRKKVREGILREIFEEEIKKVDPGFYQRLKESKYFLEDRENDCSYTLFADSEYTDEDYYRDYPTIYHLIMELIKNKQSHDARLVFLACLNIFKHRGHFLNENLSEDGIGDIKEICKQFTEVITNYNDTLDESSKISIDITSDELAQIFSDVLPNKRITKTRKKTEIIEKAYISGKAPKNTTEMFAAICGLKASVAVMFPKEEYDEEQNKIKVSFLDSDFEENLHKIEEMLTEEEYEIYNMMRILHDWGAVSSVMQGFSYLSEARIASYEKHKNDLHLLKDIYRKYKKDLVPGAYDHMFRVMEDNNYCAYVGKTSFSKCGKKSQTNKRKTRMLRRGAKCSQEEFYKRIKKELQNVPEDVTKEIYEEMANGSFLPKQLTNANGTIPYQLHGKELKAVLDNASSYLPFLSEKDESGLTASEKIIKLFEFRIPYYVGPLFNNGKGGNSWCVRKEEGKVYPWNFEEKIDKTRSSEEFIKRMIRHCTYLNNEICVPKESLIYEKYRVLNELNNLRINGERVSTELKQIIFSDLFAKTGKKVTGAKLKQFLVNNGYAGKDVELSGFDSNFANALLSYGKFCEIFNTDILTDSQKSIAEEIIYWSTIYGESKKFLEEKIREKYGPESVNKVFDNNQIKRIKGLRFKDWGNFSKEFLMLEGADIETGEVKTIIKRMWDESLNLMELLSKEYTYAEEIDRKSKRLEKSLEEVDFDDLDGLYLSAPAKRMTWQTILILKEIYEIMGYAPTKIFVEMARESEEKINGKGARKDSRKQRLLELYKSCKKESRELIDSLEKEEEPKLRSKKLYLYYMQKGRCMYSGDLIDLDRLFTNDYDIDHIYPQSVVKDDSLDNNMVLVKRDYNNKKSDNYPIFSEWQSKNGSYWKTLEEQGFVNQEKYKRLTRKDEFSTNELADFVNRQLVETRQGTKAIAELLRQTAGEKCCVVYAKAGNVSDFRHKFSMKYDKESEKSVVIAPELIKCRTVNDFHHAYDAYLNIVVGNVYDVKFTRNSYNYVNEYLKAKSQKNNDFEEKYHMNKIFDFQVERNGEIAWQKKGENNSLDIVKKTLQKNSPLVTRMNYEAHGSISKLTIWSAQKAKDGAGYISVKPSDLKLVKERYGGYSTLTIAYFFLVEHSKKGKRIRTIEALPLYLKDRLNTKEKLKEWCSDKEKGLGLENPDVRLDRIKVYSKICLDGFDLYLTGKSKDSLLTGCGVPLKIDPYWRYYVKKLDSYKSDDNNIISKNENLKLYDIILEKNTNGIYSKKPNSVGTIIKNGRDSFISATLDEQVLTLRELLKISAFENQGLDLRLLGGAKQSGKMVPNKNISDRNSVVLLNLSVTGLYENAVDLLKV